MKVDNLIIHLFILCSLLDREKRTVNSGSGDEPILRKSQDLSGLYGAVGALKSTSSNICDNGDYVPTVGRWGSEWPS